MSVTAATGQESGKRLPDQQGGQSGGHTEVLPGGQPDQAHQLRPPTAVDVARLLAAAGLWGSAFFCNAIALEQFTPIAIAAWRVLLASVVVLGFCHWRGYQVRLDRRIIGLFIGIGLLNSAVPFTLIGWGQLHVDTATTAVLISASPFATLLLSHLMTQDDRFSWPKLAGLLVGFSGVLLLLARGMRPGESSTAGMLAILLAACCYAFSALLIRRLPGMPSLVVVAGSLLISAIVLLPVMLFMSPPWEQSPEAGSVAAIVFLALGPTATAYVLRTEIVQTNGAVFMSSAGYLIPLFAVLWGWLFLSELPDATVWVALGLVLAGIAIGQWRPRRC